MPFFLWPYFVLAGTFAIGAWALPRSAWAWARDGIGLGFLLWWDPRSAALLVGVGALSWLGARRASRSAAVFWAGLLAFGGAFVALRLAQRKAGLDALLAPAGFGFATLRLIHYWIERSRGSLPEHRLRDVLGWLLYFPNVLVGPVQRFDDWMRWERRRRWDEADTARGLRRVLYGYVKVVVLSFWAVGAELPQHLLWLPPSVGGTLVGAGTLYLTFSGLSDVAIGLGLLGGQRLPENFDAPWLKTDLPAFWRSWHMSVSAWCRTYVYLPMLSRTRSSRAAAASAMAVFALWHELSVAYLAWGAWQGVGLGLWYRLAPKELRPGWKPVGWALTTGWILVGFWILRVWPRGDAWYAR